MDGTYGNVFQPNAASPLSPGTPTGASNQYKTNINRKKTRKWVEAKVQSYDGDDWGNEYDYDDEQEPEEPPLPPPPPKSDYRLPSQGGGPIPASAQSQPHGPTTSSPGLKGPSGPPALHIQTNQPPLPASSAPAPAETTSPFVSGPSSLGSATDRLPMDQVVSPQSANPAAAMSPGAYSTRQDNLYGVVSPASDRRGSPAPRGTAPLPSRFPPRKSSMVQLTTGLQP
ncbi:hypothetical protein NKR23_g11305 [Pleurostoma richardsiae]|uniref:Uncharacterized protein n=1 Tax=Pleurostoma richardsiae TaxID=41990 RepID=A0AA38RAK9_9PEZI|nr:hypothetical protein NKR23_g11305 [Pleurostoma richardsiae]